MLLWPIPTGGAHTMQDEPEQKCQAAGGGLIGPEPSGGGTMPKPSKQDEVEAVTAAKWWPGGVGGIWGWGRERKRWECSGL